MDDDFRLTPEAEVWADCARMIDDFDDPPTGALRDEMIGKWVAQRMAWERKIAALPPGQRLAAIRADRISDEQELVRRKASFVRREAMEQAVKNLEAFGDRLFVQFEARIEQRIAEEGPTADVDRIFVEEQARARRELEAYERNIRPPTVLDDEAAIERLIDDTKN